MVEILTATGIMVVIIAIVMTILSQVMSAWNESTDRLALSSLASKALDHISSDLQTALFRRDGSQWLYLNPNDPGTSSPISGTQFSRLIFFSPTALRQTRADGGIGSPGQPIFGDICAVEYRVYYADPFGATSSTQKTFTLHRVVLDPGSTFYGVNGNPVMGINGSNVTAINNKNSVRSLGEFFDNYVDIDGVVPNNPPIGPGGSTLKVSIYGYKTTQSSLIDNVAQFTVVLSAYAFKVPSTTPPKQAYSQYDLFNTSANTQRTYCFGGGFVYTAGASTTSASSSYYFDAPPSAYTFAGMAYADITLTLLSDEGMQLFQSYGGHLPEGMSWTQFLAQYSETYSTRVPFLSDPQ